MESGRSDCYVSAASGFARAHDRFDLQALGVKKRALMARFFLRVVWVNEELTRALCHIQRTSVKTVGQRLYPIPAASRP